MKSKQVDYFLHQLNTSFCLLNWRMDTFYLDPNKKNKECLKNEIEYLKSMLAGFMKYKKLPVSLKDAHQESINLDAFISNILDKFNNCKRGKKIYYKRNSDYEDLSINTHPFYFEELCRVFLENAIKYTPDKENISIELLPSKNNSIQVSIKNSGVGINSNIIENIWNPFFTNNDEKGGSGLGLSIAKQISKALNFPVSCKSDGKLFTNFFISIPNNFIK